MRDSALRSFLLKNRVIKLYLKGKNKRFETRNIRNASCEKIEKLKDTKIGKRCFIIGNGPSLTIDDLEKLRDEDTFAVNRIYRLFDKTDWRPTYYFSQDTKVLEEIKDELENVYDECKLIFLNSILGNELKRKMKKYENIMFFYVEKIDNYPELPEFSFNPNKVCYEGFTVAYTCIQVAVYMGYSEIYLIGTDHNYAVNKLNDGTLQKDDTVKNYMPELAGNTYFLPQLEKTTNAYIKARKVCEENNILIKNATRGGKLEVFERVEFDSLFEE